ncbi:hypothetical protein SPBR_06948 [Sporothrix brasiliensis 5110]|uniref:Uncharacterized protein n=1 Tax=Sporothrix brasiliensis 5110 TaxID=1398154 RepID=A0A0C2IQ42_9PEZI|nr:uncharacterized protein SPBR_06948 [Sporothrix brasiliensis 5110]KIH89050.1 hypothetical protein SPBR_06948 [Sporothrix brasiliensis 5110]
MGAEQSSSRGAGAPSASVTQKTCYYELLSVERTATDDEIKKAYRRKALELHPDRNIDDTANATRRFAEVQTAYEVLSDPQERAWYDSHRDAILRGDSGTDDADDAADAGPRFYNNVRLTPTEDLYTLMGRFNSSVPFNDSPSGFFGILEATFAQLGLEEEAAFSWDGNGAGQPPQYAPFGSANDDYDAVGKPFYRDWSNFATVKSFSWKDKYRLSDAPDRTIRRLMEKENKKARDIAAREFNDAVRSLVAFVRKRDPRYVANTQSEAERQKILRDSANAQAARQRAANLERRAAAAANQDDAKPLWARGLGDDGEPLVDDAANGTNGLSGEFSSDAESDEVQHEIECVVCDKTFKSEKQFEAHEKSKKHAKAVHQLRRQMKKDNRDLNLVVEETPKPEQAPVEDEPATDDDEDTSDADVREKAQPEPTSMATSADVSVDEEEEDESSEENDEYAPREVVEKRFQGKAAGGHVGDESDDDVAAKVDGLGIKDKLAEAPAPAKPKIGKAKAKREKKAARWAAQQEEGAICDETFDSNTKLHKHLRTEHPAPEPKGKGSKGKKKR